jgi:hypothetical protein
LIAIPVGILVSAWFWAKPKKEEQPILWLYDMILFN